MIELLFLLLPVAAASGWWLARRGGPPAREQTPGSADPAFFRGLKYLLDEQPDKAIDVFLKLAEVDRETVETHLALGSLFRRRGEVERAIRIHQNLVARDNLNAEQRGYALFELGQDYMRAGLFDRAETLFQDVVDTGLHRERALLGLLDIYQQERDWVRCLEVAERLAPLTDRPLNSEVAHYHCELAEEARRTGSTSEAKRQLQLAEGSDPGFVRAAMLESEIALADGQIDVALERLLAVAGQGAAYLPDILPSLVHALDTTRPGQLVDTLETLAKDHPSPPMMLTLSDALERERGPAAAAARLIRYLSGHADLLALERLLDLRQRDPSADPNANAESRYRERIVLDVVRHLLPRQPVYQCEHCGFEARALHWQCPSCKRWGSVKAVEPERIPGDEVLTERRIA